MPVSDSSSDGEEVVDEAPPASGGAFVAGVAEVAVLAFAAPLLFFYRNEVASGMDGQWRYAAAAAAIAYSMRQLRGQTLGDNEHVD